MKVFRTAVQRKHSDRERHGPQRGVVAVIVGLSMVTLVGAGGLALDLARLYVNRSELQTAADACALAAAGELICSAAAGTACLNIATAKGQHAAVRNSRDFQRNTVNVPANNIRFSTTFVPNSAYLPAAGGANPASTFVSCTAASTGITPWLMGVLGVGSSVVTATAVATKGPGSSTCPDVPIGVCPRTGGGSYAIGEWVVASHNDSAGRGDNLGDPNQNYGTAVRGTFRWVDWDYPGGGVNEVRDRLVGRKTCDISVTSGNIAEPGDKQGAKQAYNTRFGLYPSAANAYTPQTAPPDRTGFSYPTRSGVIGASVYADYQARYGSAQPYQGRNGPNGYDTNAVSTGNANPAGNPITSAEHQQYGSSRRLVTIPVLNSCPGTGSYVTLQSFACFLLLNPMGNGNNSDVFMEYRGSANDVGSPCVSAGTPGGVGGGGALVPVLVQ